MNESESSRYDSARTNNPWSPARTPAGFLGLMAIGSLALIVVAVGSVAQARIAATGLELVTSIAADERPGPRKPWADGRLPFGKDPGPMKRRHGRPSPDGEDRSDRRLGGGLGSLSGLIGTAGRPVHGEVVVEDPAAGDNVTIRFARGAVTAVSATSVTLKCADGYEATFAVDDKTRVRLSDGRRAVTDLKTGDTALAVGRVAGETATATLVTDLEPGGRRGRTNR